MPFPTWTRHPFTHGVMKYVLMVHMISWFGDIFVSMILWYQLVLMMLHQASYRKLFKNAVFWLVLLPITVKQFAVRPVSISFPRVSLPCFGFCDRLRFSKNMLGLPPVSYESMLVQGNFRQGETSAGSASWAPAKEAGAGSGSSGAALPPAWRGLGHVPGLHLAQGKTRHLWCVLARTQRIH